jgi:hypothetical protein
MGGNEEPNSIYLPWRFTDMAKTMKNITIMSALLTVLCICWRLAGRSELSLALAISFGTIAYHLLLRLTVGAIFNKKMDNHADYTKKWYKLHLWERELYRIMGIKRWRVKQWTYNPEDFSPELHSWGEIAQAMCQAELVHEMNAVLSFAPIVMSVWFGKLSIFLITSIGAALFDLMFVITQRFNRFRIVRYIENRH